MKNTRLLNDLRNLLPSNFTSGTLKNIKTMTKKEIFISIILALTTAQSVASLGSAYIVWQGFFLDAVYMYREYITAPLLIVLAPLSDWIIGYSLNQVDADLFVVSSMSAAGVLRGDCRLKSHAINVETTLPIRMLGILLLYFILLFVLWFITRSFACNSYCDQEKSFKIVTSLPIFFALYHFGSLMSKDANLSKSYVKREYVNAFVRRHGLKYIYDENDQFVREEYVEQMIFRDEAEKRFFIDDVLRVSERIGASNYFGIDKRGESYGHFWCTGR